MQADLRQLFQEGDPDQLVRYVEGLDQEHFSLVTFIDSLVPELVMESNLRFGSFHLIKMSLFLRSLSRRGVFSPETEKALAGLVVQHLFYLEWISVSADRLSHAPDPVEQPLAEMLEEIGDGNAHNAYFYASQAFLQDKEQLFNTLLLNGSCSIQDTIGHAISCFYPVLEEVVATDHPAAGTALLSQLMFLCRFRKSDLAASGSPLPETEKGRLLAQAASGTGIVEIHHMITFYICQAWEKASWNRQTIPPWSELVDWLDDKKIDQSRLSQAAANTQAKVPENYESWRQIFTGQDRQLILQTLFAMLDDSWEKTADWLFRAYAEYYTPDWDPHYYTSLYAALELYHDPDIARQESKMALIQALEYFLDDLDP